MNVIISEVKFKLNNHNAIMLSCAINGVTYKKNFGDATKIENWLKMKNHYMNLVLKQEEQKLNFHMTAHANVSADSSFKVHIVSQEELDETLKFIGIRNKGAITYAR